MWLIRGTEDVENIMCVFIINKINNKAKASEISLYRSMCNKDYVNSFW